MNEGGGGGGGGGDFHRGRRGILERDYGARPGAFLRIDRRREYSHIIRLLQLPRISAFSPRHTRVRGKSMRARSVGGTPTRVRAISLARARSLSHATFLVSRATRHEHRRYNCSRCDVCTLA